MRCVGRFSFLRLWLRRTVKQASTLSVIRCTSPVPYVTCRYPVPDGRTLLTKSFLSASPSPPSFACRPRTRRMRRNKRRMRHRRMRRRARPVHRAWWLSTSLLSAAARFLVRATPSGLLRFFRNNHFFNDGLLGLGPLPFPRDYQGSFTFWGTEYHLEWRSRGRANTPAGCCGPPTTETQRRHRRSCRTGWYRRERGR